MPAHISDFASSISVSTALTPIVRTTSITSSTIDMVSADGSCFAIQLIGAIADATTWAGSIEESADGVAWAAIAAFAVVSTTSNIQTISFRRTKRYVRYVGTVGGGPATVPVAAVIGEQLKTF